MFCSTEPGCTWLAHGYVLSTEMFVSAASLVKPKACVPHACPHAASEQNDLCTPETHTVPPEEKFKAQGSSAKEIKGNGLLNWVSSGDLPRASEENFITLKELSVHLSPTYTAHRSTANQHWACLHLSVSNRKEACIQNAFISLCIPASVTCWAPRYDVYFQVDNL